MCRTQSVLALVTLYVGLAHSWDIAVSLEDELVFYTNGSKTDTIRFKSQNLTALAYDDVHNTMLYVDKQSAFDGLCGYNLLSKKNKCFIKRYGSNIHSIAYDPVTDTLFFSDNNLRTINSISLNPESEEHVNYLAKLRYRAYSDIAVDSCKGYIYFTNRITLERAIFNGSEREVIQDTYTLYGMTMDPQIQNFYYLDGIKSINRFLNRRGLDGQNVTIELDKIYISDPKELTVSNDYLYWMNGNVSYKTIWYLPKNAMEHAKPKEITNFDTKTAFGIAANYKIKDKYQGLQDCPSLWNLISKTTVTNDSLNVQQTTEYATVADPFCVHGMKVSETSVCKCTPGYIGGSCDVSVCKNHCLQGDCSINDEGLPKCRCNAGYSGERCEVYACHDFCLNNGDCSFTEEDEPVCRCADNYDGIRCEAVKDVTINNIPMYDSAKKNLTLADILSRWRKPISKMFVTVEV